jgi:hypothetical protein
MKKTYRTYKIISVSFALEALYLACNFYRETSILASTVIGVFGGLGMWYCVWFLFYRNDHQNDMNALHNRVGHLNMELFKLRNNIETKGDK